MNDKDLSGSGLQHPPTICATCAASVAGDSLIGGCRCQPDGCRRWKPNRRKFIPNETPSGWIVRTRMGIFTPILSPRKACMSSCSPSFWHVCQSDFGGDFYG